jgi:hypothetical protein
MMAVWVIQSSFVTRKKKEPVRITESVSRSYAKEIWVEMWQSNCWELEELARIEKNSKRGCAVAQPAFDLHTG